MAAIVLASGLDLMNMEQVKGPFLCIHVNNMVLIAGLWKVYA